MRTFSNSQGLVVVTGASTGIGQACTRHLASCGYCVVAGIRDGYQATKLYQDEDSVHPVHMDVTSEQSISRAHDHVVQLAVRHRLIGLVNNAGIGLDGRLEEICLDQTRRVFDVNVFGLLSLTKKMLPILRQHRGRIVNVGSTSGRIARPGSGVYCASKAALESITNSMRMEMCAAGMKVVMVEPGSVDTPFWQKAAPLGSSAAPKKNSGGQSPSDSGMAPSKVAHIILKALTATHPRRRYIVGYSAQRSVVLNRILSQGISEYLRSRRFEGNWHT